MIPQPIGDIFAEFRLETNVAGLDFGGGLLLLHQASVLNSGDQP
jgi:hypothetical protein